MGTMYSISSTPHAGARQLTAFTKGDWRDSAMSMSAPLERPNVFKLYEENIGPLTPLIADALKDAEQTYSERMDCRCN